MNITFDDDTAIMPAEQCDILCDACFFDELPCEPLPHAHHDALPDLTLEVEWESVPDVELLGHNGAVRIKR